MMKNYYHILGLSFESNPEPQLIKHLIIIQMIASMIVCALMIIVEGQNMNPMEGMLSIILFMFMAAFTAVLYNRF